MSAARQLNIDWGADVPRLDPELAPALSDADMKRRVLYLRKLAAEGGSRGRLARSELLCIVGGLRK